MSAIGSVTYWLQQLQAGEQEGFQRLWERYFERLVGLARQKSVKRPLHAGKLTNNIVYERLAPGVLEELKRLTPRNEKGRPKHHYHRRLTEDVGHPRLREHLSAVVALMRAFDKWDDFYRSLNRALPKQVQMPLFDQKQADSDAELGAND